MSLADVEQAGGGAMGMIDPVSLRRDLTGFFRAHGDATAARCDVLARIKELNAQARSAAEEKLLHDGDGRACASFLSATMDEIVSALFDFAATHAYPRGASQTSEELAIVATGGYGRGLLAPGSDVDLLFLLPYKQTAWSESVVEFLLYLLWDAGFKVGHATRNIDQCMKFATSDDTIRSALLDARFIHGNRDLFESFQERFWSDTTRAGARAFVEAKMRERDLRHERSGQSRFLVEPNIKDGKGGLRDLHTLHWLSLHLKGIAPDEGKGEKEVLSVAERALYNRCEGFLWTVRCHLHFLSGRAEERLTFDVQSEMARRLKYRDARGLRAVERFMKHYFITAKRVGDLTRNVSAALEFEQLKDAPRLATYFNPASWVVRRQVRRVTDFVIENDRVDIIDPKVFERDPLNVFRILRVAVETGSLLHPNAYRRMRRAARSIDDGFRENPDAADLFLFLLAGSTIPEDALRRMHGADILGQYMPEFGQVTAMMQFNMYHHYTVDEHLLRTVGELRAIEDGVTSEELPLATEVINDIENRRVLYLAALVHDIGKGRPEDHSVLGAQMARTIGRRLGFSKVERDTLVWLVREHLTMSLTAQNRDLSDPRTIQDFVATVGSIERLNCLLLLTVADIRAVGPGTWNGWKGSLLRQLYYEAANKLRDDASDVTVPVPQQIKTAQDELRTELVEWDAGDVDDVIARHYDDYWLRTDLPTQVAHARLLQALRGSDDKFVTQVSSDAFTQITDFIVVAPNHPRLLSVFAGCCAAAGANIIGAQINTTRDGLVIDDFALEREFDEDVDEERRSSRIIKTIDQVLTGRVRLIDALRSGEQKISSRARAFSVEPKAVVDNTVSDQFTVIDVSGRDRRGLLYDLTSAISDLSLDIISARITTFGERAVDSFYVTDLTGKKVIAPSRKEAITGALLEVLEDTR